MKCENIRIIPINNLDFLSKIAISSDITSRSELVVLGKKDAKKRTTFLHDQISLPYRRLDYMIISTYMSNHILRIW